MTRASAAVRRAVLATLDRIRAEQRADAANDDLTARMQFELVCRESLDDDEQLAYQAGVTVALGNH